jgi:hypothetical protein
MKDEVKITVIATGFRTDFGLAHVSEGSRVSAAAAIQQARTHSHYDRATPTITSRRDEPVRSAEPVQHVEAVPVAQAAAQHASVEAVQVEERKVTSAPAPVKAEYEQDDLDVPAFLRKKRNE